jgi:DNA-binding response OmpR family regulator
LRIAYLEDDIQQSSWVQSCLQAAGHTLWWTANAGDLIHHLKQGGVDLVMLDWELPDTTGIDVLKQIRRVLRLDLPVLFCTQRDSEADVVLALEAGADDYLIKPIRAAELNARLLALGRRAGVASLMQGQQPDVVQHGPYRFDLKKRVATHQGAAVNLTDKDFDLAVCLFSNLGRVLSRQYLLEMVWGVNGELNTRTVDVHISRIRKSLSIAPEAGYRIRTIYQHGYRLESVEAE